MIKKKHLSKKFSKSKFNKRLRNIRKSRSHIHSSKYINTKKVQIVLNKFKHEKNVINQVIFPIISINENKEYFPIGTGFFINELGWFLTAKHVVMEDEDKPFSNLYIVHILNEKEYKIRQVKAFFNHPTADISVGTLVPISIDDVVIDNSKLILKRKSIAVNDEIFTYGYPETKIENMDEKTQIASFSPDYFHGKVVSIDERDDTFFRGTCIQTTVLVKSGASGGPAFDQNGYVLGVNTSGYDLEKEGDIPISFLTPIKYAYEIQVPYNSIDNMVPLEKLVELKGVTVEK